MMRQLSRLCGRLAGGILLALWGCGTVTAAESGDESPAVPLFETDVRPLLKAHCFHCHGDDGNLEGGLDLRLQRLMLTGGESGPALVPGKSAKSLVLQRIVDGEMPPGEDAPRLDESEIARIRAWIDAGAKTQFAEPDGSGVELDITVADTLHWSFQPIASPQLPPVPDTQVSEIRNGIDRWIAARLAAEGFQAAGPADRRTLIRRLSFDLRGLPPTPEEVDEFVTDRAEDAWQRVIDRMLATPEYGERWGRHWLDAAGYADSEGVTNEDLERPHAFHYRDYVIQSFNDNKPWNRFLIEQLAGDELVSGDFKNLGQPDIELLTATGFLRMAPDGTGGAVDNPELARNEVMAETIKIVSSSILGLTVGCAQCHSHRYDPITQVDYYSFRALFEPALNWKQWKTPKQRLISLATDADRAEAAELEKQAVEIEKRRGERQTELIQQTYENELAKLDESIRDQVREAHDTPAKERSDEQNELLKKHPSVNVTASSLYLYDKKAADELKALADQAKAVRDQKPKEQFLRALTEPAGAIPETFVFDRGDHEQPKHAVAPNELTVIRLATNASQDVSSLEALCGESGDSPRTSGRRLEYARWLTDPRHPLTSRVIVNRVWMHHFGQALVTTPEDFGLLGTPPTHPELLDWLAAEFIAHDWDLKWLHRLILNSAAYRRSHLRSEELARHDPDNQLLGARLAGRVEAEVLRDTILEVSGQLNRKPFGPAIPVMADRVGKFVIGIENLNAGRPGAVIPMRGEDLRRSVYVQVRRSRPLAVLDTFDLPQMTPNCTRRPSSTVTPQSLMLMNSSFVLDASRRLADRVTSESPDGDDPDSETARIQRVFELALSRPATQPEIAEAKAFLAEQVQALAAQPAAQKKPDRERRQLALATLCQAIISSNEFLYID